MRHPIATLLILATLAGCGSEGPSTPAGATASFSVSARVVPVRCDLPSCPAALPIVIPVRVTESGGIIGGYVTMMDFVMRDAASGSVLESRHYDAAQIASMTLYESNQVYPSAWLEIVAHPFRITDGESRARTVSVAITITDYRGNEHHQTLDVSVV
jgi:hypothetical protein